MTTKTKLRVTYGIAIAALTGIAVVGACECARWLVLLLGPVVLVCWLVIGALHIDPDWPNCR